MNDKLFAAIVVSNLINEITGGEIAKNVVKNVWSKAPSIVKSVGAIPKYVGDKVKTAGEEIHKFGEKTVFPKGSVAKDATPFDKKLFKTREIASAVTKGLGSTVKGVGGAVKRVGEEVEQGGKKWEDFRANSQTLKDQAEANSHEKEKIKLARQHELRLKEKENKVALDNVK